MRPAVIALLLIALCGCTAEKNAPVPGQATGSSETPRTPPGRPQPQADGNTADLRTAEQPPRVAEHPLAVAETPPPAEPQPSQEPAQPAGPTVVEPFPHVAVNLTDRVVEFDGIVCIDVGWLEQIVCGLHSREHESLVVSEAKPSHIHSALLMAGFEAGTPGQWHYTNREVTVTPPEGPAFEVSFEYQRDGEWVEVPAREWVRDHLGQRDFPDKPWIFGGSMFVENPQALGGGEVYAADYSGSIIGLVTFGDELLGFSDVLADQEAVQPAEWEVDTRDIPAIGTPVTVVLRPHKPQ